MLPVAAPAQTEAPVIIKQHVGGIVLNAKSADDCDFAGAVKDMQAVRQLLQFGVGSSSLSDEPKGVRRPVNNKDDGDDHDDDCDYND